VEPAVIDRFEPWHFLAQQMSMHVAYVPFAQQQILSREPVLAGRDGSNAWATARAGPRHLVGQAGNPPVPM
jgi:hypothetical protein